MRFAGRFSMPPILQRVIHEDVLMRPFSANQWAAVLAMCFVVGNARASSKEKLDLDSLRTVESDAYEEARVEERRELVSPAPPGFKPKARGRKLAVRLIARDGKIKIGEPFWYRLELVNEGSLPIEISESRSFIKRGDDYDYPKWEFTAVTPKGVKKDMAIGRQMAVLSNPANNRKVVSIPGAEKMTDAQIREFMRKNEAWRREDRGLRLTLRPGETLSSRPWKGQEEQPALKPAPTRGKPRAAPRYGGFREFWTGFAFDEPGRYEISVVYNDPTPKPPGEDFLKEMEKGGVSRVWTIKQFQEQSGRHLGQQVTSNRVVVEVLP